MRLFWRTAGAILVCLGPHALSAQRDVEADELLGRSQQAFDDLDFHGADSVARLVAVLPGLRRTQRLRAYEIEAAARFPSAQQEQYRDSAVVALRNLIRLAPRVQLFRSLRWSGLDALVEETRANTFGAEVSVPDTETIEGLAGVLEFKVMTNRPARFSLHFPSAGQQGEGPAVDSIGPTTDGTLRLVPVGGDAPKYGSGAYHALVIAIDPASGERITIGVKVDLTVPILALQSVPDQVDPKSLLAEHTHPSRASSVVAAVLVGAFSAASTSLFRNKMFDDAGVAADHRGFTFGVGLGLVTGVGSWLLDRGRPIPPNIAHNQQTRLEFDRSRAARIATNENSRQHYRAIAVLALDDQ